MPYTEDNQKEVISLMRKAYKELGDALYIAVNKPVKGNERSVAGYLGDASRTIQEVTAWVKK